MTFMPMQAPPAPTGGLNTLALIGATLQDVGSSLDGREPGAVRSQQALQLARSQAAQRQQALQGLLGLFSGSPTASAPSMPPQGAPGLSGAVPDLGGGLGGLGGVGAAPTPTRAGPDLRDPRVQRALLAADAYGVPGADTAFKLLSETRPDIMFSPDGQAIDKRDPSNLGKRFANPTFINGLGVDQNDPKSIGLYVPEAPTKGANPVFDASGRISDWSLPVGAAGAIGTAARVDADAKNASDANYAFPKAYGSAAGAGAGTAPYDLVTVQLPDGSTTQVPKSALLGGQAPAVRGPNGPGTGPVSNRSQTPADKAYSETEAKADSERYQGLLSAGNAASGNIANYQQVGALLKGVNGSSLSVPVTEIARVARGVGIDIDPKLGAKEAAASLTNQMAMRLRDPSQGGGMPGAMSDADRNFLAASVPRLAQSDDGRRQMVDLAVRVQQRNADVAAKARAWTGRFGRLGNRDAAGKTFDDYLAGWTSAYPLFGGQ